jgi:hypothetical protein
MKDQRRIWDQLGQLGVTPWDYKIASLRKAGMSEDEAKNKVVMEWMQAGNFRPLLARIKENGILRGPVLGLLAQMLASGQLTLKAGPGRPPDPEAAVRDQFAADIYEDCRECFVVDDTGRPIPSDALFEIVGSMMDVGDESVKKALKAKRKSNRKP